MENRTEAMRLARKTLRYLVLYGPQRTLAKVRGQYHMRRHYDQLPSRSNRNPKRAHVGLIGCGNFAFTNIAYYLRRKYGDVICGVMDVDEHRAASLCRAYGARYFTTDPHILLSDPAIDLVYVASNHATHAEYAIKALEAGKHVHIEKPHVVTAEQLYRLYETMTRTEGRVNLGFNRPNSRVGREILSRLLAQSGPSVLNWFVVGHEIPEGHWYYGSSEGGRILGNLCHWTDFVLRSVPPESRYPLTITPTRGSKPDCDIAVTLRFGDDTIAAITFSAQGFTLDGVRERFSGQRGNLLVMMDDFLRLTVEEDGRKSKTRCVFRDQGHQATIVRSYEMVRPSSGADPSGCPADYVWETGQLFLETRQALLENRARTITSAKGTLLTSAGGSNSFPQ